MQLAQQHIEHAQCVLCHVQRLEHIVQYAPVAHEQGQRLWQFIGQLTVATCNNNDNNNNLAGGSDCGRAGSVPGPGPGAASLTCCT